jgi:hypothetical protein
MGLEAPMAAGHGYPVAGGGQGKMRAADADRDQAAGILSTACSEGRLSRDEYDARLQRALPAHLSRPASGAGDRAEPAGSAMVRPPAGTNGLAIASLACGLAQFTVRPLATIPATVLGHMARRRIRRTGEQGAGLALSRPGTRLGSGILGIILIAIGLAIAAGTHGAMPMR